MRKKLPLILKRIMLFALVFSLTLSTSVSASGVGDHDNSGQSGAVDNGLTPENTNIR